MTDDLPGFLDSLAAQQAASAAASSAAEVQSLEALLAPGTEPRVGASAQLFPSGSSQAVYGPAEINALDATLGGSISTPGVLGGAAFGPTWRRFILGGVYNGDLELPPPTVNSALNNDTNILPYWSVGTKGNGAATAKIVADASQPFGYAIQINGSGLTLNSEVYLEQLVPIVAARDGILRPTGYVALLETQGDTLALDTNGATHLAIQYIKADGVTTVGSEVVTNKAIIAHPGSIVTIRAALIAPAGAAFLRVRVGLLGSAGTTSGRSSIFNVRLLSMTMLYSLGGFPFIDDISNAVGNDLQTQPAWDASTSTFTIVTEGWANAVSGRLTTVGLVWGQDGVATNQNAGAISDASFVNTPVNGTIAHDTTNHRQYYKRGGAWHYSAETAGFQIPEHETFCPVCREPLLPDDDLLGKGDRVMADGALHALYIHLRCAGKPLDRAVADAYWTVADTDHENPDHRQPHRRARSLIARLRRRRP